jgi:hypothetical protein
MYYRKCFLLQFLSEKWLRNILESKPFLGYSFGKIGGERFSEIYFASPHLHKVYLEVTCISHPLGEILTSTRARKAMLNIGCLVKCAIATFSTDFFLCE